MPTGNWLREGQSDAGKSPRGEPRKSTEKYQPSIHRGKEHGTLRRWSASGEEARSQRETERRHQGGGWLGPRRGS